MATMSIKIHVAWWLKPYFYVLATIHALTGCKPNYERVQYWIGKAITVKSPRRAWYQVLRTSVGSDGFWLGMMLGQALMVCVYLFARWLAQQ